MMIRSFADLHPLLRQQYATNKELIERAPRRRSPTCLPTRTSSSRSGPTPTRGIFHYCTIQGRGVLREAFDAGALISRKVNTLPVSDRNGAPARDEPTPEKPRQRGLDAMPNDWDARIAAAIAAGV
jgi:hypothetical protein